MRNTLLSFVLLFTVCFGAGCAGTQSSQATHRSTPTTPTHFGNVSVDKQNQTPESSYYLDVANYTGNDILYLYVSPEYSDDWEEDVLGDHRILNAGDTFRVNLTGYETSIFDVKCVDDEGESYTFFGVDVAREDITVRSNRAYNPITRDYYIEVDNETGYDIHYIYISPEESSSWEEDVLGRNQILENGDSVRVDLSGYDSPMFDVKCVDEDGDSYTFYGVNVAREDLTVRLTDLD